MLERHCSVGPVEHDNFKAHVEFSRGTNLKRFSLALVLATAYASLPGYSQAPTTPAPAAPVRQRPPAFPERPPADPASIDRGKAVYGVHCTFCHGADARGGSGGPNLDSRTTGA